MIPGHLRATTEGFWRAARALADGSGVADGAAFYLSIIADQAPTERLRVAAMRHLGIVAGRRQRGAAA